MTSRQAFPIDQNTLDASATASPAHQQTLRESVELAMQRYFGHLDGETVSDLYGMVLTEVEVPLLEAVMRYADGNQTRAADMLGLNRGTLRKKLKQYDLI
ncbi:MULTISPECIES: DNA-binding transcriptional regulator Fis [Chromohalobacter]|uniref:Putative Fis-like DNA-binding protein n=3 Tax=Chromohalobacter TaxID=42054 RepID=A0A285VPM2_9GAMM|nr:MULTISPECIES: DNA-binding transcriptional regulator Fis [Chromohalobacter]CDQ36564.1 Hin recombinational enhancer-binding protein [Virgibacillus halodenitrificans]MCK0752095.1 DNA-binding transcriptional regulator Fis [Chromohalobacter japonicus]MCK0765055.1 DNA-binding transcriptional regulator Fis [Chromohalobacter beijerinckii]MCK0769201.1 DNA-binding transcriptional regulator Fis [Chromohalobacter canadensis]MCK2043712.1 DNA-binding transcriptional regulator Fis [Chromohalobacter moromi